MLLTAALTLCLLTSQTSGYTAQAANATITFSPPTGAPGSTFEARGYGFQKRELLQLTWAGTSSGMPMVNTSHFGAFTVRIPVPTTAVGSYMVGAHTQTESAYMTFTVTASAISPPPVNSIHWSLIGNDLTHLANERAAGVQAKVVRLSWRDFAPAEGTVSATYTAAKRAELSQTRRVGFQVVIDIGLQDTPTWVHQNYQNSYYVNQYGDLYRGDGGPDSGDANLVFNSTLRGVAAAYIRDVFNIFGTDIAAVRIGGGRYGELTYPPATYATHTNSYWAFDANTRVASPVGQWQPGMPSPNGEAVRYLDWYLNALTQYQSWQISALRASYNGTLMLLYPSWGIRPGQANAAVAGNLSGTTSAEINGEIQRGYDFGRQIAAIADADVLVTTTWLDADGSGDGGTDQRYWSPVKYLTSLATAHPLRLGTYGENTGQGTYAVMQFAVSQMQRYGLVGMAWYREEEMYTGQYATLANYQHFIVTTP